MKRLSLVVLILCGSLAPMAAQTYAVVVSGLGGDAAHRDRFHGWAVTLIEALQGRMGLAPDDIIYLAERPERDPALIDGRSTKASIDSTLTKLAHNTPPQATVLIVLMGHGSYQGRASRISLPGPDMSADDFRILLDRFHSQTIVFVNTASASGDFIAALSAPNRTVVTATKSPFERNETAFGEYFVKAVSQDVADVDKDERVSILEAFNYAKAEVARVFEAEARLLTEHAMLDDDGDGIGSSDPGTTGADGALARTVFLDAAVRSGNVLEVADSGLRELYRRRMELEEEVQGLRNRKDAMGADEYDRELERLLLELARTNQSIRDRERGKPTP